jgi:hypothetical protein
LEEINERLCLKDDVAFALLIVIFPHTIVMFNEIDNLPRLDTILNWEPIGLGNHVNQHCGSNIGEFDDWIWPIILEY